jgi:hypothetical protein
VPLLHCCGRDLAWPGPGADLNLNPNPDLVLGLAGWRLQRADEAEAERHKLAADSCPVEHTGLMAASLTSLVQLEADRWGARARARGWGVLQGSAPAGCENDSERTRRSSGSGGGGCDPGVLHGVHPCAAAGSVYKRALIPLRSEAAACAAASWKAPAHAHRGLACCPRRFLGTARFLHTHSHAAYATPAAPLPQLVPRDVLAPTAAAEFKDVLEGGRAPVFQRQALALP